MKTSFDGPISIYACLNEVLCTYAVLYVRTYVIAMYV